MAIQNGTEIVTGSHDITYYDVITIPESGAIKTTHTAKGTAGSEIGYIYTMNTDGTYDHKFTQSTTAGADTFTYADGTITFGADDTNAPVAGDKIAMAYTYATADNAQKLSLEVSDVPDVVLVTAYGICRDVCSGELFPFQIEGQAQVDGNWSFELSADGDPVVQNLSMEFVKTCTSEKLYDMYIYTEDDE